MRKCIVNTDDADVVKTLRELGLECIPVLKSDRVSVPICRHSDVLYQKVNSSTMIISSCQKQNLPAIKAAGYDVCIFDGLAEGYKTECALNFIINDSAVIHNPRTSTDVDEICQLKNLKRIKVRQGYTKCSTLCLSDTAYITDDDGIYRAIKQNEFECLKISKGMVILEGYNYGFIGGASVNLLDGRVLFFGDIPDKAEKERVCSFLFGHNIQPLFIPGKQLTDLGSALIL